MRVVILCVCRIETGQVFDSVVAQAGSEDTTLLKDGFCNQSNRWIKNFPDILQKDRAAKLDSIFDRAHVVGLCL